jgi:restriction endonuclease S subunit
MQINNIAEVISGYTFRVAIKPEKGGNVFVFQARDIVQNVPFSDIYTLTRISHETLGYAGYLKKNDVLLIARGMKSGAFRSTIFVSNEPNVIASSSVHVIRITTPDALPEYVSHYLNSKVGQDSLSGIVSGSYIGALPRRALEKIKIPIPSLQKQETIVNLHRNIQEQQRVLGRKNEINQNILNATFRNLTTN